ncbi:MAG: helix-turn-helix domain-containing protein [Firmicutes bacterium]|nr:helix-turn-helix domain-containing protein [Bacillota bacterium]
MSDVIVAKVSLLNEFISLQDITDKIKILRLRRKIQKFIKTYEADNTQLIDVMRVLDLWVEELEYHDFNHLLRIATPVIERCVNLEKLDFYDTLISSHVVGYCKDFLAVYTFAGKIIAAIEKFKSNENYHQTKLVICMNVLCRLLRVRYFELSEEQDTEVIEQLTSMFTEYVDKVAHLCKHDKELWEYETVAAIRKALFDKNYDEVDEGLLRITKEGRYAIHKALSEEVNRYNAFAGTAKTKLQLNIQLGKNIRKLRKSKFLKIDECAALLKMTPSVLQSVEQGKRSAHIYVLYKISETFNISLDEIVTGDANPAVKEEPLTEEVQNLIDACQSLVKSDINTLIALAKQLAIKDL